MLYIRCVGGRGLFPHSEDNGLRRKITLFLAVGANNFAIYYSARAIASISMIASLGKRATCTADRAGGLFGK
jgi:hypothetical protein